MVERHVLFARNPLVISIDIFDDTEGSGLLRR